MRAFRLSELIRELKVFHAQQGDMEVHLDVSNLVDGTGPCGEVSLQRRRVRRGGRRVSEVYLRLASWT
jgi:hypothetical protein